MGDEIRSLKERKNLLQLEFVSLLNLSADTFSCWESGRNVRSNTMDMFYGSGLSPPCRCLSDGLKVVRVG